MFSQTYQNGEYGIEIFSPSGNDPFKLCKLANESNIQKVYDRDVKGYMVSMEESSSTSMQWPRSPKASLGITQPLLVVQLQSSRSFSLELILLDSAHQRRRFHLSTSFKEVHSDNLHVRLPWTQIDRHLWCNAALNLAHLVAAHSPPSVCFKSLDSFTLHPVCRVRKIFSLPLTYLGDVYTGLLVPPKFDFPPGVEANCCLINGPHRPGTEDEVDAAALTQQLQVVGKGGAGAGVGDVGDAGGLGVVGQKLERTTGAGAAPPAAPTAAVPTANVAKVQEPQSGFSQPR
ncbi:hypothetical protein B484DRAFT_476522 [Ochromonadaceae sp. CCMP2298]|nr:hypothetical protein B484DRAFT_476522 [Ochromonadaceae sp. CCMP2298]